MEARLEAGWVLLSDVLYLEVYLYRWSGMTFGGLRACETRNYMQ